MAFSNVGTLTATPTHKVGSVSLNNLQDVYQFTVPGPIGGSININASIHDAVGNNPAITPTFRIFRDSNGDGKLTTSGVGADTFVKSVDSNSLLNEGPINFTTRKGSGTFFAAVDRPSISTTDPVSTSYQIDLSATDVAAPSNLVPVKLSLGNLTKEKSFSGNISTSNTSDVFSFSLISGTGANITLGGISVDRDIDIRVLRDNGDRIFQQDELVATSALGSNLPESITLSKPGNYLVQVYQFKGNSNYDLKLSPFAAASPNVSNSSTPILFAAPTGGILSGNGQGGILVGGSSTNTLLGHGGDDILLGGDSTDRLNGGAGKDQMFGGKGSDTLMGGSGDDTFVLARQNGRDFIKGFQDGIDYIGLDKGLKFEDLTISSYKTGSLIRAGKEELAFVQGIRPNQLAANDFIQLDVAKLSANLAGLV